MIDIAVVNGYFLLNLQRMEHPDNEALKTNKKHSIAEFRKELVHQLSGLEEFQQSPVHKPPKTKSQDKYETVHLPVFIKVKRNCKVCHTLTKKELKVLSVCSAP